jgi:glyceraldehyde-3-phosphate dehydrogenase (NADP+)
MAADQAQPLLIGGEWTQTKSAVEVTNPYSGQLIRRVARADESDLEQAVVAAQKAFEKTRRQPAHHRAEILRKVAAGIEKRLAEFARTISAEAGKPIALAELETKRAIANFTFAAEEARREHGETLALEASAAGEKHWGLTRRFPIGIIYGISPFNFPLNLVAHKVGPCLATGNVMILKPATKTPLTALLLGEVLCEAGIEPGQVNIVVLPSNLADRLVTDDRVKMVTFTGSPAVGWMLKAKCGKKKITLELGGNAGVIVHEDADLAAAVPAIAYGAFSFAGQVCISVQRIMAHERVYEAFKSQFVNHVREKVKTGDPSDKDVLVGPMIDSGSLDKVMEWIAEAKKGGAMVLCGGERKGNCLSPTVIENVKPDMSVCAQEVFAPIVTLQKYKSFEEALQMVNDSRYGLQAGVYTRDINNAWKAFTELEVGGVLINQIPLFRVDNMPYGGVKDSGFGREGVKYAMEEMTELRTMILKSV